MNKKIAKTLLVLSVLYICAFYVIKFIFPEFLLDQLTDPNVLALGNFLNSHTILLLGVGMLTTFLTFYLFVCASRGKFKLKLKEFIYIIAGVILSFVVTILAPNLMTHTSTSIMLLLALLCNGKKEYFIPTFIIHGYLSQFLSAIKGYETIITEINAVSGFMLGIEGWLWLFIFSLVFYLKEDAK